MENSRLLACLADDFTLLRAAVHGGDLGVPVPSCPEWTVEDLTQHVALVYLHKVECMRHGLPDETAWPPEAGPGSPTERLDRAYDELTHEFATRDPGSPAGTWYEPDQTVGFWLRRMAQETVMHRIDAQLARGALSSVPDDLALDGIDEVLDRFLAYGSQSWPKLFEGSLPEQPAPPILLSAQEQGWLVRAMPTGVDVTPVPAAAGAAEAAAHVTGDPESLLLWLWGRAGDDRVSATGDQALLATFWSLMRSSTQ